jgi:hypothetical protein
MNSGRLNLREPSGPLQSCNGIALPFYIAVFEAVSAVCWDSVFWCVIACRMVNTYRRYGGAFCLYKCQMYHCACKNIICIPLPRNHQHARCKEGCMVAKWVYVIENEHTHCIIFRILEWSIQGGVDAWSMWHAFEREKRIQKLWDT